MPRQSIQGMQAFTVLWIGQVISLVGTAMTGFALTIWAWQETGSATALALVGFFTFAPTLLFGPTAGALVDRWNLKLVMMLSDLASGLSTIAVLILYATGNLEIWHLYITGAFSGFFQAFQWPAYSAAISAMLTRAQYGRAGGMMSLAEWGSGIFAPVLGGLLISQLGIGGVLIIDIVTFTLAIVALLIVTVPERQRSAEGTESRGSLRSESTYGFRYILARPSLLGLQMVFFFGNLLSTLGGTLLSPMVLARTNNNELMLGSVLSAGAAGGVVGSLLVTAWGGPKRRIYGVLGGWILTGLFGSLLMGINAGLVIIMAGAFFHGFFGPLINTSNQVIWQSKVPPDIQGKVFAVRRVIAQVSVLPGMLIAGPLADFVLEPAMRAGGEGLPPLLRQIAGTGPGAGMGVMLVAAGVLIAIKGNEGSVHRAREARYNAGNAVANGLPYEAAIAALTVNPARIFGQQNRFGAIAPGQEADVVVWTGDPLEPLSQPTAIFIRGQAQPLTARNLELRDRYRPAERAYPPAYGR